MAPDTTSSATKLSARHGILVGVDGSDESLAAVAWAAQEAALRGSAITLMHVISPMVVTWPIQSLEYAYAEWQNTNAQTVVERAQQELHAALGVSQLSRLDSIMEHRSRVADTYTRELSSMSDLIVPTVERGLREVDFWSMETAGESPSMKSTSGLSIWPRNCRAYAESDST